MANRWFKETAKHMAARRERDKLCTAECRSEETTGKSDGRRARKETKRGRLIAEQASLLFLLKVKLIISALSIHAHGKTLVVVLEG